MEKLRSYMKRKAIHRDQDVTILIYGKITNKNPPASRAHSHRAQLASLASLITLFSLSYLIILLLFLYSFQNNCLQ